MRKNDVNNIVMNTDPSKTVLKKTGREIHVVGPSSSPNHTMVSIPYTKAEMSSRRNKNKLAHVAVVKNVNIKRVPMGVQNNRR